MMGFFRNNLLLLGPLLIAGVIFGVYGCPYFHDLHHPGICVLVYALLVLVFVYGRAVNVRRRPRPPGARTG